MKHSGIHANDLPPAYRRQITDALRSDPPSRAAADPQSQRRAADEPLGQASAEAGDPKRHVVRITSYRRRLLDEDNLVVKYHVDALRYLGLIPGDAPNITHIPAPSQIKVRTAAEERTEILIIPPSS